MLLLLYHLLHLHLLLRLLLHLRDLCCMSPLSE